MADYNELYLQQNNNDTQGNKKRVYINPNFNKSATNFHMCSKNTYMHVNPKFQHFMPNQLQQLQNGLNANKIYVNPNFIRSEVNVNPTTSTDNGEKSNANDLTYSWPNVRRSIEQKIIDSPTIFLKSRYCLVRRNENKSLESTCKKIQTNTIKISKYKSVPIHTIKKDTEVVKSKASSPLHTVTHIRKQKLFSPLKINTKMVKNLTLDKRRLSLVHKQNKIEKQKLKKNNIPCPLFKKYGKCLRVNKGNCEFLHDKNHVNICRRFLKGSCHDENCLLSHDLTAKKMPTCYFYLNGVCAKENCPYLHVKINEKTKICPDFLKGYCEKADNCTYRHINLKPKIKNNVHVSKKQFQFAKCEQVKFKNTMTSLEDKKPKHEKNKEENEYRYYKDLKNDNSIDMETIKPSRCKLGILPTFIQL